MGVGGEGLRTPPTDGRDCRRVVIAEANDPQRAIPPGISTGRVAIKAWDNSGVIYIGWDEEVTTDNGYPLDDGDVITLTIDVDEQNIWMVGDTVGDEVRIIAMN